MVLFRIPLIYNAYSPRIRQMKRTFFFLLDNEKTSGFLLIGCTIVSLLAANIFIGEGYLHLWHSQVGTESLEYWINDGLMTLFFLLVGLELRQEIRSGELSSRKKALLPLLCALGGMFVPALLYMGSAAGTPYTSGAGVPMATDIAFALGILSLCGKRVPPSLRIFLTALAVIDDLGAILVIALFYTETVSLLNLGLSLGIFGMLLLFQFFRVNKLWPYLIGGIFMWYFMLHSGVHATITGVLVALAIPVESKKGKPSLSHRLEDYLKAPVNLVILPLFALANTAIPIGGNVLQTLTTPYGIGIAAGLVVGKPLGVLAAGAIAVRSRLCRLPKGAGWRHMTGIGFLAGIGFTMSIFITLLAFDDPEVMIGAKLAILLSSLVAGAVGYLLLVRHR